MSSIEQLNDFAEAGVGSNLLDCCVEEVRGPSKCGSKVVPNTFLFRPHVEWSFLRSRETGRPGVGYDVNCAMIATTVDGVLVVKTPRMEIV